MFALSPSSGLPLGWGETGLMGLSELLGDGLNKTASLCCRGAGDLGGFGPCCCNEHTKEKVVSCCSQPLRLGCRSPVSPSAPTSLRASF